MVAQNDPRQLSLDLPIPPGPIKAYPPLGTPMTLFNQHRVLGKSGTVVDTHRGRLAALCRAGEQPATRVDLIGKISPRARASKYDRVLLVTGNRRPRWYVIGPGWTWFLAAEVG